MTNTDAMQRRAEAFARHWETVLKDQGAYAPVVVCPTNDGLVTATMAFDEALRVWGRPDG